MLFVARSYRHHERAAGLSAEYYFGIAWAGRRSGAPSKRFATSPTCGRAPPALETRFREVRDDPQSNLSKINPAIEIYAR